MHLIKTWPRSYSNEPSQQIPECADLEPARNRLVRMLLIDFNTDFKARKMLDLSIVDAR